jgi:uncharacterized protein
MHRSKRPQQQDVLLGFADSIETGTEQRDQRPKAGREYRCVECLDVLNLLNTLRSERGISSRDLSLVGNGAHYLHARHQKDGVDACKVVVRRQVCAWARDDKMREYLTLQTLFRESNFDRYAASVHPLAFTKSEQASSAQLDREQTYKKYLDNVAGYNEALARSGKRPMVPICCADRLAGVGCLCRQEVR